MEMMMDQEKQGEDRPMGFEKRVDEGFTRIDEDIRELRGEMNTLRSEINTRLDGLQRTHYAGVVAIIAALIATNSF